VRRTYTWALALVAGLVLGMVGALPASAVTNHIVKVTVTTAGGRGVPNISLTLSSQEGAPSYDGWGTTNASGVASFTAVPTGSHTLSGSVAAGSVTKSISQTVTVSAADVATTIKLAGVQAVTGKVTDKQTGAAIADASIWLGSWSGDSYGYGNTDAAGVYLALVPAGYYRVSFVKYGTGSDYVYTPSYYPGTPDYSKAAKVTVVAGTDKGGVSIALSKPGKVAGKVTYAGNPVKSAAVSVSKASSFGGSSTTTSTGTYAAQAPAGTYKVSVRPNENDSFLQTFYGGTVRMPDAKNVTLLAGKTVTGVNITAKAGATVKGVVKNSAGTVLKGIPVYGSNATRSGWATATTNASGVYVLRGLASGSVQVSAEHGDARGQVTVTAAQGKTVAAKTVVLRYAGYASITGTIAVKSGGLRETDVTLLNSKKVGVAWARPTATGAVRFAHLAAGTYTVVIDGSNTAKKLTITSGQKASFGKLTRGTKTTVRGYVRTPSGKALAGAWVSLFDSYGTWAGEASTNASGYYAIKGLVKGTYTVQASDNQPRYAPSRSTFTMVAGTTVSKSLKLKTAGILKGVVKNAAGKPVAGVSVNAVGSFAVTNSSGVYVLKGVPAGATALSFYDPWVGGYRQATKSATATAGSTVTVSTVVVR
jgi:hypothetical protein